MTNAVCKEGNAILHFVIIFFLRQEFALKPWPKGVASRSKLKTWIYLRRRLARACAHLR